MTSTQYHRQVLQLQLIKHNIPEIGSGRWLRDLALAIKPVSDVLNAMFITESTDDQRTDPSRYLEASVRIRELVETNISRRRMVTRGHAFAAEFDGELAGDERYQDAGNKRKSFKRARTPYAIIPSKRDVRLQLEDESKPSFLPSISRSGPPSSIHGPCAGHNSNAACMENGRCTKKYPRPFSDGTSIGEDGYPLYRRRDRPETSFDRMVQGTRVTVDNRWVVPYNPYLT